MKSFSTLLIESIFVGILLVIIIGLVYGITYNQVNMTLTNVAIIIFISGALFHLLCEITGINIWYAREYCKLF